MKTIFITGATAGFGEATARLFAQKKWNLILTGRREDRSAKLAAELQAGGIDVCTLCFDVRDVEAVKKSIAQVPQHLLESLEVLVNNAGLAAGRNTIQEGNLEDWNAMIDTNIKGILHITQTLLPFFITKKKGHIVNIGSIAGREVYPQGNVYCASKFAVNALSQGMRIDLLPHNIKVTNIAPGAAETEFSLVRFKGDEALAKSIYNGFDPLVAQDIAETIDFVVSRPEHVTINELVIMPTAQPNATQTYKQSL